MKDNVMKENRVFSWRLSGTIIAVLSALFIGLVGLVGTIPADAAEVPTITAGAAVQAGPGMPVSLNYTILHQYPSERVDTDIYSSAGNNVGSVSRSFSGNAQGTEQAYILRLDSSQFPQGTYTVESHIFYLAGSQWNESPSAARMILTVSSSGTTAAPAAGGAAPSGGNTSGAAAGGAASGSITAEQAVQQAYALYIQNGYDSGTAFKRVQALLNQYVASPSEWRTIAQNDISGSTSGTSSLAGSTQGLTPEQKVQKAFQYLISQGFSAEESYNAIKANLQAVINA